MRALILAAGRGSRLGSMTDNRPKGMLELCGKCLIDWQLAALRAAGIQDIALVGGYHSEMLETFGLPVYRNARWEQTNMVSSLLCARNWLVQEDCVVSYSDIVYSPDHVRALLQAEASIAITYDRDWLRLWSARFADPLADAETFRLDMTGMLLDIGNRPACLKEVQGQYMGLLKFTRQGTEVVIDSLAAQSSAQVDRLDMTKLLKGLLAAGIKILPVPITGRWGEVDNQQDVLLYETWSRSGKPFWLSCDKPVPCGRKGRVSE